MKRIKPEFEDKDKPIGCGFCARKHPYLDVFVSNYFKETTLHGVKYIASGSLYAIERIFWVLAVLSCLSYAIYLVWDVFSKYYASPVIISFQPKETGVSDIPFSAITICNVNLLKNSVLTRIYRNLSDELKLDPNQTFKDPKNLPINVRNGAIILDNLAQFCLGAQSFRRKTGERLVDPMGRPDFINLVQNSFGRLDEKFMQELAMYKAELQPEIDKALSEATMTCEDMILKCLWAGNPITCTDHFSQLETRNGRCCVFNMMPKYILQNISLDEHRAEKEARKLPEKARNGWGEFVKKEVVIDQKPLPEGTEHSDYPKFQKAGGQPYGLSILINPDLNEYSTCTVNDGPGFKLVAHSPVSSPAIIEYAVGIPLNSEVFVDIEPDVTFADRGMLSGIGIDKRGCYLAIDSAAKLKHFNFYTAENCISECIAEHTWKNCSCVTHFMPHDANQLICGAKRRKCVMDIRANVAMTTGANAYCKQCLPPCTEITYKLQMSQFDLREHASSTYTYESSEGVKKNASNYSIIHLYYGTDSIYAKERKTLYDTSDLIANAGGLLSLTLGMSIVSIVELAYFFTLRAWFEFRSIRETEQRENANENDDADDRDGKNPNKDRSSRQSPDYNGWINRDDGDFARFQKRGGRKNLPHLAML